MTYATLKKRSDFVRVAQIKNIVRTKTLWVQFCASKNSNEKIVRVGYTASRKVGNAVCRNRAKRRMRSLVRCCLDEVLIGFPNYSGDFVIIGIPATITCGYTDMVIDFKNAVRSCLNRVKPTVT